MYCTNCEKQINDQAKYCQWCGKELIFATTPESLLSSRVPTNKKNTASSGVDTELGSVNYAGFWKRFLSYTIDGLIISIVPFLGYILLILKKDTDFFLLLIIVLRSSLFLLVIGYWLYFTLMESSTKQATLGKMQMGIIVTDLKGNRISFGRANGRFFAAILSRCILCMGYMMAGFTPKKQALHDMIAGTLVITKSPKKSS